MKSEIGCYTFKRVLQYKRLPEIWSHQVICHILRTCGNYSLIPRVCENCTGKPGEKEICSAVRRTHSYTLTETTHCGRADCGIKRAQQSTALQCSLVTCKPRPKGRGRADAQQHHSSPHQHGEDPFRPDDLCYSLHHRGIVSKMQKMWNLFVIFLFQGPKPTHEKSRD